jgi:hypothetical protein
MSDDQRPVYRFHKVVQSAYVATHSWLGTRPEASGYKQLSYDDVKSRLKEHTLLSTAAQFHTYFPAHFFKIVCALNEVIAQSKLIEWLNYNPQVCLVDIGCGAGAGSAAFVEFILKLQESGQLENSIQVHCVGIDPNPNAIALYVKFLQNMRDGLSSSHLDLVWNVNPNGIPSATGWIIQCLNGKRSDWKLPHLPHVIILQVNIVSPLDKDHDDQQAKYRILEGLDVDLGDTVDTHSQFGVEQALAYKSIFEGVAIDHMHVVTISTKDYLLGRRVEDMGAALEQVFTDGSHQTEILGEGECHTVFCNPKGSRFEENKDSVDVPFFVNIVSATSRELHDDTDWHEVISLDNLRLAWVRTRRELLQDSFIDELDIRLFEDDLDANLDRMRHQLMAYAEDLSRDDYYVAYKVPKGPTSVRPRGLSPIEEELLSVAIIQRLGNKESQLRQCSYAYKIVQKRAGRDTEYLYEYWLEAYNTFLREACDEAKRHETGAVLREDIAAFYTRIEQDKLARLTTQALIENKSRRIEWLIRLLLSRDLDEHELGRGIVQGNIGSGFYANVYLTAVDMRFGADNEWGVKFFRYADDMIFVLPEPQNGRSIQESVSEVKAALEDVLDELKLDLNEEKHKVYDDPAEFVRNTELDALLEQMANEYYGLTNRLWILDSSCRSLFRRSAANEDLWWYRIRLYCRCLQEIGIYVTPPLVSRWIHRYLFVDPFRRKNALKGNSELILKGLPSEETNDAIQDWAAAFLRQNPKWVSDRQELYTKITNLFFDAWNALTAVNPLEPDEKRRSETRLRFAINRLASLGFGKTADTIIEILLSSPWVTKEPSRIVESVARQGFARELLDIFSHYRDDTQEMNQYLRSVVLRAIRFLPEVHDEHWDIIVEHALVGTLVERLMATETWLLLSESAGFVDQEEYTGEIRVELTKNVPSRLAKNYILLLSQYPSVEISSVDFDDSPTLLQAYRVGSRRDVSGLLGYVEPSLIRERYYSGTRADESGFEYIS